MSYIQIEIGPSIEGQSSRLRGLKFNTGAWKIFATHVDANNYVASAAYAMIYAGLWANCFVKRIEPDFTFEQVCEWVDDLTPEVIQSVTVIFNEMTQFKELLEATKVQAEQTEDEKKNIGLTH